LRTYELMFISRGSLDETAQQALSDRFTNLITQQGGTLRKVDQWGKRPFAYELEHMTEGYYTVVEFDSTPEGLVEVERQLKITDDIIRHKVVRPGVRMKRRAPAAS
jgi:small subunit ribosomal protein S6